MAQVTIYIADDLYAQVKTAPKRIVVSKICAKALREEVERQRSEVRSHAY